MTAGGSAAAKAAALRAGARRGPWRRLLTSVGVTAHTRRADAQAADWDAGAEGERRTAALLAVLKPLGWVVLHDRVVPGAHSANADDVLASPGGKAFTVDTKLWSASGLVQPLHGKLMHGRRDADQSIRSVLFETDMLSRALGVPVQPLIVVHNAPVAGRGLILRQVPVVPAGRLLELLVGNDWPRNPAAAAALAARAAAVLPPYRS